MPAAPAGFMYVWHPAAQQFVLAIDPSAQGQPVPTYAAPGMPAAGAPPRGRPAPIQTCKLVRPGNVDKYAELLATTQELMPAQAPHLFGGLQPDQNDMDTLISNDPGVQISGLRGSRYTPPFAADPMNRVTVSADPGEDAFPRPVAHAPMKPLAELPPNSGVHIPG